MRCSEDVEARTRSILLDVVAPGGKGGAVVPETDGMKLTEGRVGHAEGVIQRSDVIVMDGIPDRLLVTAGSRCRRSMHTRFQR